MRLVDLEAGVGVAAAGEFPSYFGLLGDLHAANRLIARVVTTPGCGDILTIYLSEASRGEGADDFPSVPKGELQRNGNSRVCERSPSRVKVD